MPDRTERRLTRNTTVMTLHSDSESDYEHSQGFDAEHRDVLFSESGSYNFDGGLTSILSGGSIIDLSHLSAGMQAERETMTSSYRRFAFQGQGSSEEEEDDDLTENTEDENGMGAADMFNQDSEVNFTEEDEDSDDDDDDDENDDDENEDAERSASPRNNVLGRYLLASMGFDDDESTEASAGVEGYGEAAERFQIFAGVNEFDGRLIEDQSASSGFFFACATHP